VGKTKVDAFFQEKLTGGERGISPAEKGVGTWLLENLIEGKEGHQTATLIKRGGRFVVKKDTENLLGEGQGRARKSYPYLWGERG